MLEYVVACFAKKKKKPSVDIMVNNEIWYFYFGLKIATIQIPIKMIV